MYEFKCFYSISCDGETIAPVAFQALEVREPSLSVLGLFFFFFSDLEKRRTPSWSSLPHGVYIAFKSHLTSDLFNYSKKCILYHSLSKTE